MHHFSFLVLTGILCYYGKQLTEIMNKVLYKWKT